MAIKKNSSRGRQASGTSRNSNSKKGNFNSNKPRVKKEIKKATPKQQPTSDTIRLNKYIANAGICSRREADTYIKAGSATVNGKVITEMGYQVKPDDVVRFDGELLNQETKRYVLLNKPKNYITSDIDERGRKTVMELLKGATKERIYPVGRLDRNSTGLLLFTNDGDMVKKLTNPKSPVKKLYHASLDRKLALKDLQKIGENVVIEGKTVFIDEISYIEGQSKSEIGIQVHSGRNQIIRKIFEQFGYKLTKLDVVLYAGLTKKNLPRGRYRHLTQQEIINLKMI